MGTASVAVDPSTVNTNSPGTAHLRNSQNLAPAGTDQPMRSTLRLGAGIGTLTVSRRRPIGTLHTTVPAIAAGGDLAAYPFIGRRSAVLARAYVWASAATPVAITTAWTPLGG